MTDDHRGLVPRLERLAADATEKTGNTWACWSAWGDAQRQYRTEAAAAIPLLCETIRELVEMSGSEHWSTPELDATLARARSLLDPEVDR